MYQILVYTTVLPLTFNYLIYSSRNDRHLEKDPRDFRSVRDNDRDRDRDFRNPRDRFDRDDRKFDRDRMFSRRDMDDRVGTSFYGIVSWKLS